MASRAPGLTIQGILLFLFAPLVLYLLLGQPLGPGWSVAIGLAIMAGHRFLAAPWAMKFADARCLWCGLLGVSIPVGVRSGGAAWPLGACSAGHAAAARDFLGAAFRFRRQLAAGIFLPLAWLIGASIAAAVGHPLLPHQASALLFRVVVAATVLAASLAPLLARGAAGDEGVLRCPLPVHNFLLLGMGNTLWVFRIVGAWWLIDGALRLWRWM